jgi:hypothetical protein
LVRSAGMVLRLTGWTVAYQNADGANLARVTFR